MSVIDTGATDRLLREARARVAAGQMADAMPLFQSLLEIHPNHVEARNAMAVAALRSGELARARAHLGAALAAAPDDALTLNHWAQMQQAEGDVSGALQTYARLLDQEPSLYSVRLAFARLLEATGDRGAAARQYFRAIRQAQRAGRWLSLDSTPAGLRPQVTHAMALVDQQRRAICDSVFAPLVQTFGRAALARVSDFIAVQLGEANYAPADARQRPTGMAFPGLPQSPYLDPRRIAGVAELEAQTHAILAELQGVLGRDAGREQVFASQRLADAFLRSDRGPATWDGYYFYRHGHRNETNASRCPVTMAAIDRLPLARVRGYGPEVLFSTLGPGTHLRPHHGVTNTRVVCHLPLIVPPDCVLRVAGEPHHWRFGEVVAFDDTYSHEALNGSAQTRVVLIFDVWHPDLSPAECTAVCALQEALGDFGGSVSHGEVP